METEKTFFSDSLSPICIGLAMPKSLRMWTKITQQKIFKGFATLFLPRPFVCVSVCVCVRVKREREKDVEMTARV